MKYCRGLSKGLWCFTASINPFGSRTQLRPPFRLTAKLKLFQHVWFHEEFWPSSGSNRLSAPMMNGALSVQILDQKYTQAKVPVLLSLSQLPPLQQAPKSFKNFYTTLINMFFAPAIAVIAATGIQSAYAGVIPALTQQAAIDSIVSAFDASPSNDKRDVEIMELMRRSFEDMDDEEKQATIAAALKGLAPSILGFAASFIPSIIGKFTGKGDQQKRDILSAFTDEDKEAMIRTIWDYRSPPFLPVKPWIARPIAARDLDFANMSEEDKKAFWPALIGAGISLFSSLAGNKKRDVMDYDAITEEEKKAFWQLIPLAINAIGGLFNKGKRDEVDHILALRDVDFENMSEEEKKAFWPALIGAGVSLFSSFLGNNKRDLENIVNMSDEDKEAFFPALIGGAISLFGSIFGGNKKRDLETDLSDEDKEAFWQLIPLAINAIGGLFNKSKRDVSENLQSIDFSAMSDEEKKAFFPALIGGAISIFGSLFGGNKKRGLDSEMSDEDKEAFWQLIPAGISLLSGLFGNNKRDIPENVQNLQNIDFSAMSDEEKKAFFPALIGGAISLFGSIFGGNKKRDMDSLYDNMGDDEKKAFWQLIPAGISLLSGLFGNNKRDLEHAHVLRNVDFESLSEEEKKAFFPALIGGAISLFGSIFGGNKRRDLGNNVPANIDFENMSDEEKKAFFPALIGGAISLFGSIFGGNKKRDLEHILAMRDVLDEDKEAIFPALIGIAASILPVILGNNKRDLASQFVMRSDAEEMLYARDSGFADAFFAEEF
ncbi:hypothetical protein BJ508DRAFT_178288 [Ascobolus immersus RN42]|uniref:Uncharacterized protein n=1 Tax=Ascobolus immersus RN42 TaxID=1160509 RepID=A0A3N4IN59_ASCIM|nr:hypothetical protein BJ508DRAFT_178288 [Ascobolus immersus RN42]